MKKVRHNFKKGIELHKVCAIDELRLQFSRKCEDCDALCECHLSGANPDDVACEYFDDTSLNQLRQNK